MTSHQCPEISPPPFLTCLEKCWNFSDDIMSWNWLHWEPVCVGVTGNHLSPPCWVKGRARPSRPGGGSECRPPLATLHKRPLRVSPKSCHSRTMFVADKQKMHLIKGSTFLQQGHFLKKIPQGILSLSNGSCLKFFLTFLLKQNKTKRIKCTVFQNKLK